MPNRKKRGAKKSHSTKRRKVSGIKNDGTLEALAGGVLGLVAAQIIENSLPAQDTSSNTGISDYAVSLGEVVIGSAVAYFSDNWFLKGVGIGIAAQGVSVGLVTFGVISGVDKAVTYNPQRKVAGYRDVKKIGDFPKPNAVGEARNMQRRAHASMYKN